MEIKWLWLSFVCDPLLILLFSLLGVFASKQVNEKARDTYSRISEYTLKAVALTAAVVGIAAFPQIFKSGPNGESMILLAFGTLVVGAAIGSWSNMDVRLENFVNRKFNNVSTSKPNAVNRMLSNLDASKFEKDKTFGWAAAYSTYVSLVGVLSIMGPVHESVDGVTTFIIMKCVLDSVASFVFAMSWGPGVVVSALPVFVFQFLVGVAAPLIGNTLSSTVISFMDAVGGVIIMAMGMSVSGILKGNDGKSFRTGNFFPAMILAWVVGNVAIVLKFFW